jgi:16S rRNA processing protein RimM
VGAVTEVLHLPDQDLLVIGREGATEVLVPFVTEIVPEIDLSAGQVVIDPPHGLLDPAEADEAAP